MRERYKIANEGIKRMRKKRAPARTGGLQNSVVCAPSILFSMITVTVKAAKHFTDSGDGLLAGRVYLGPVSDELQQAQKRFQAGTATGFDKLTLEKFNLEQEIADLKANKKSSPPRIMPDSFKNC